jgi:hypothetical protein
MSLYQFRFRFHISQKGLLKGNEKEIEFSLPNGHKATFRCLDNNIFDESTKFIIVSGGYDSEEIALTSAKEIKKAVLCFGTKYRLGVDVGKDKANGGFSKYVKDKILVEHGLKIIDNVHGISVYTEDYPTSYVTLAGVGLLNPRQNVYFAEEVCKLIPIANIVDEKIRLGMELLTSSYFESSTRSRFVTLVFSAESIANPEKRSDSSIALVNELLTSVKTSKINSQERDSLLGSLSWLKNDSISQCLRKMTNKYLPNKIYGGLKSDKFISKCYEARSTLVHNGAVDEKDYDIGILAADLEVYMTDMLSIISGMN